MADPTASKRIEISLPLSTFAMVQAAAARRGLTIRGFVASCAYEAALQDARQMQSLAQSPYMAPGAGDVGEEEVPADSAALRRAREAAQAMDQLLAK